jgi:diguanylate cyclase (GGDEF)-like protein
MPHRPHAWFAFAFLLGLALACVGTFDALTRQRNNEIEKQFSIQHHVADAVAQSTRARVEQIESHTHLVASTREIAQALQTSSTDEDQANAARLLIALERTDASSIIEVRLLRADAAPVQRVADGESRDPKAFGLPETTRDAVGRTIALTEGTTYWSAPHRSGMGTRSSATLGEKVQDEAGVALGAVLIEYDLSELAAAVGAPSFPVAVIDFDSGVLLESTDAMFGRIASPAASTPDIQRIPIDQDLVQEGRWAHAGLTYGVASAATPSGLNLAVISAPKERVSWFAGFGVSQVLLILFGCGVGALSVAAHRRRTNRWHHLAIDDLTGLPSRRALLQYLETQLGREGAQASVVVCDVNRFREINDTVGPSAGDAVLCEVGRRIGDAIGPNGVLARLGGDEFAVVLTGVAPGDVHHIAHQLVRAFESPIRESSIAITIDLALGIAHAPEHGRDPATLLRNATVAMHAGKSDHRGITTFHGAIDDHSPERLAIVSDLVEAINSHGLDVHFQPKIRIADGEAVGVEALCRWTRQDGQPVPPDVFIPIAERNGLIQDLTKFVLDRAIKQAADWNNRGLGLTISVNVSMLSMTDPTFAHTVSESLQRYELDPLLLILEVTESELMRDPSKTISVLTKLRDLGVGISIDDFGTGYSSLSHLDRLPATELKIDRTFIKAFAKGASHSPVVKAAVELGHSLGLRIVAEGIEDHSTLLGLRSMGCDEGQGYFMSRPLPADEATAWLMKHRETAERSRAPGVDGTPERRTADQVALSE